MNIFSPTSPTTCKDFGCFLSRHWNLSPTHFAYHVNAMSNALSISMKTSMSILTVSLLIQCIHGLEMEEFFPGERDALIQLRDIVESPSNGLHANWTGRVCITENQSSWAGVGCSDWHVTHLVLEGIELAASVPLPPMLFQNLTFLTKLSFTNNSLHGPLPNLTNLVQLQDVFLSKNRFSGSIPWTYIDLPELAKLELQENDLSGQIPPFDQQTLIAFNVSNNQLEGPVPQTHVLQSFPESSYANNPGLCGYELSPCPVAVAPTPFQPPARNDGGLQPWSIALIAAAAVLFPASLLCLCCCYMRKANLNKDEELAGECKGRIDDSERSMKLEFLQRPMFELDDLLQSAAEVIGKGKLGTTYKAILECGGSVVAVKRLERVKTWSKKEMHLLGNIKHPNVAEMISFYHSKEEKLIVYEYVPGQSLFSLLHERRGALDWKSRVGIIKEIAEGLNHLHESSVTHGNLKSSNVVVQHDEGGVVKVKLTDYGLVGVAGADMVAVGRTPEFVAGKKVTRKSDVYCFGIVVLEIVTGRAAAKENLSGWVREAVSIDWSTDIVDMEILGEKEGYEDMLKLTEMALHCTDQLPEQRPQMSQLLTTIHNIINQS